MLFLLQLLELMVSAGGLKDWCERANFDLMLVTRLRAWRGNPCLPSSALEMRLWGWVEEELEHCTAIELKGQGWPYGPNDAASKLIIS